MAYVNGRLPAGALGAPVFGGKIRKDLVPQTNSLALAFASKFYRSLQATDTYRDRATQETLYKPPPVGKGPGLAAYPGTSNHGWGTAIDFSSNINRFSSAEHQWMQKNAPRYGWNHPYWARQGGGREEAWHWEASKKAWFPRHTINYPQGSSIGLGDSGDEVLQLQKDLNKIYRKRGIKIAEDGDYGMGTYALVRRFQRARGYFRKQGVAGKWTKSAVKQAAAKAK